MEIAACLLASALFLLVSTGMATDSSNNPADQLVAAINSNRTAHKSSALADNQGLGCIALEYIKAYGGVCTDVGEKKIPTKTSFADTFAPNCGVDGTTLAPITGRLLGCQSDYVVPGAAFDVLITNSESLQILYSKNHTEVGAAVSGTSGGGPYFWCVLFSSGNASSSFAFEGGVAKSVRPGCYSGNDDPCSGGAGSIGVDRWRIIAGLMFAVALALAV